MITKTELDQLIDIHDNLIDIRDNLIKEVFSGEDAYLDSRSGAMLDNLIDTLNAGLIQEA